MIYQYTSVNDVIGRVLRNTRLTDTGVISDLPVWVGEAMEMLQTSSTLEPAEQDVQVKFFQGRLPCGLVELDAVLIGGKRLGLDISSIYQTNKQGREVDVYQQNYRIVNPFLDSVDIRTPQTQAPQTEYYLKPGYICLTKTKDATITLHYKRHAIDDDGFPLIPDNGNYKEALYWFVRGKLIGAGILEESKSINEHVCNEKWELLAARAINEITYPSIDKMEKIRANQVNFAIPENYWSNLNRV